MINKVKAIMILEMAGRPAEHLAKSMEAHVKSLKSQKGVTMISERISEPKKIESPEGGNEMYTCFAEVEVELINFSRLIEVIFDFFPSSIEVIEPASLTFNSQEATAFTNDLSARLHRYDEIAKIATGQAQQLAGRLKAIQEYIEKKKEAKNNSEETKKKPKSKKGKKK